MIGCKEDLLLKLEKIIALKNNGQGGERKAAETLLKKLCIKYDISIADIECIDSKKYIFHYRTKWERKLFTQIYCVLTNNEYIDYCPSDKSIEINCSSALFVELSAQYDFYRKEFNKALDEFLDAFICRHQIYDAKANFRIPETTEEVLKAARIYRMAGGIGGNNFHKQIKGAHNNDY
jgi:hypothetical protein